MKKCLITRLQGSVDNAELPKYTQIKGGFGLYALSPNPTSEGYVQPFSNGYGHGHVNFDIPEGVVIDGKNIIIETNDTKASIGWILSFNNNSTKPETFNGLKINDNKIKKITFSTKISGIKLITVNLFIDPTPVDIYAPEIKEAAEATLLTITIQ